MTERILKIIKKESGAVHVIESAIVFPVMFIILFFLIFMGNMFFIKSRIEEVVERNAIKGANYCADPILTNLIDNDTVPALTEYKAEPYRYIFGGMGEVESEIRNSVIDEIENESIVFFKNMDPELVGSTSNIAKFNNYVVYSTFSVEVKYRVSFPIRFLGSDSATILEMSTRAEMPVNDAAEFIRNTDMVIDLFTGTKVGDKISEVFGKINEFLSGFAEK